jgi:hypothetical protein
MTRRVNTACDEDEPIPYTLTEKAEALLGADERWTLTAEGWRITEHLEELDSAMAGFPPDK